MCVDRFWKHGEYASNAKKYKTNLSDEKKSPFLGLEHSQRDEISCELPGLHKAKELLRVASSCTRIFKDKAMTGRPQRDRCNVQRLFPRDCMWLHRVAIRIIWCKNTERTLVSIEICFFVTNAILILKKYIHLLSFHSYFRNLINGQAFKEAIIHNKYT